METYSPEMKELLIKRLEMRNEQGRLHGVYRLGTSMTPEQMIEEAKSGTPLGDEILMAEKQFMDELKRRR